MVSVLRPLALARDPARAAHRRRWDEVRLGPVRASLALRLEDAHFRQRETVELARVSRGVGAGVADVDEVALLQVRRQRLLAHDDVHRVTRGSADRPRHVGARAVSANLVLEALTRLDHAAEEAGVPMHPALAGTRRRPEDPADEIAGIGDQVAAGLGDD